MYGSLDISTSALIAQRTRMDVISANLANKDVILNENGDYEPFRRRVALLGPGDPSAGSDTNPIHPTRMPTATWAIPTSTP